MGIVFWICTISVVCIITSVIFYKPYLGIAFVIISIPFEGSKILDCISIYPLEAILTISVLICIYKLIVGTENYFRNIKLVYACIPFVLCIMLSAIKSIELSLTAKELVRWLELFLIYYLTINLINDDRKMRVILYSMVLAVAIVSIWGIVKFIILGMGHSTLALFNNPNPFAGYINLIIPVSFGMLMVSVFLWEKITLGIFTVLSILAWFSTFSRSAYLSLILTIILVFFMTKIKKRVALFLVMLLAVCVIVLSLTEIKTGFVYRFRLQPTLSSLEHRTMPYPVGLDMVKDNLILGIGIGNYPLLIEKYTTREALIQTNLHNLYLQVLVETGIIGLCAFVFWLVCIVKYLVRSLKALEKTRNYSLFVGLVGGVIVYLFNNLAEVLTVHGIHLQWGIILGLAVVLIQSRESEKCPETV